jgi:hypothetical protein
VTFRRFVVGWTVLALIAWLLLAGSWNDQIGCKAGDVVCFESGDFLLIAAVIVGVPWLFGLFVVGIVVGLVTWHRKLSSML